MHIVGVAGAMPAGYFYHAMSRNSWQAAAGLHCRRLRGVHCAIRAARYEKTELAASGAQGIVSWLTEARGLL
jgi:hypothetical protein